MSTCRRLVAAAPSSLAAVLSAPARTVPVLHRGLDAVYLDLSHSPRPAATPDLTVLGLLSSSATAVPCGLHTTMPHLPADVVDAQEVVLGAGRVLVRGSRDVEIVATRAVDVTVPRLPDTGLRSAAAALAERLDPPVNAVRAELPPEALADLAAGSPDCVPALLGRGSGLTPVGDDVLCGWLAIHHAVDREVTGVPITDAVRRHAPGATTALSATLLGCAVRGEVLPEFRRLVLTLIDPPTDHPTDLEAGIAALLRVGHTSGAGLLLGATIALHHLASRSLTS